MHEKWYATLQCSLFQTSLPKPNLYRITWFSMTLMTSQGHFSYFKVVSGQTCKKIYCIIYRVFSSGRRAAAATWTINGNVWMSVLSRSVTSSELWRLVQPLQASRKYSCIMSIRLNKSFHYHALQRLWWKWETLVGYCSALWFRPLVYLQDAYAYNSHSYFHHLFMVIWLCSLSVMLRRSVIWRTVKTVCFHPFLLRFDII